MTKPQTGLKSFQSLSMMRHMGRRVVNVATVPHRSLFRYPGGKTWLVPYIRQWINSLNYKPETFIEPFAGGGIVGLSVLFEELTDHLVLIELDEQVSAVWETVLGNNGPALASRIVSFSLTKQNVIDHLARKVDTDFDRAFQTILRNRVQRGGIMAPGAGLIKQGENGHGIASRWYPETLSRRILDIFNKRDRITFIPGDGIVFISDNRNRERSIWFLDPPYTIAGKRLYRHSEVDHERLFKMIDNVKGDFLITYDDVGFIRELATSFGFDFQHVPMKTTHHAIMYELLVGRNLDWARQPLKLGKNPLFEQLQTHGHTGG